MAFIRKKSVRGINYYSIVTNRRMQTNSTQQITLKQLGTYPKALEEISRLRYLEEPDRHSNISRKPISPTQRQKWLIRIAELEGTAIQNIFPESNLQHKQYEAIIINPLWEGNSRITPEQLYRLPIHLLASDRGCALWLWVTNATLPVGFQCLPQWNFTYRTTLTWIATKGTSNHQLASGKGDWLRSTTQHCLLATKGKVLTFGQRGSNTLTNDSTAIFAPKKQPIEKPQRFYQLLEKLLPHARKLEIFLRQYQQDWIWREI